MAAQAHLMNAAARRTRTCLTLLLSSLTAAGCAQPFSEMQSARLVGPKQLELTPSATTVAWNESSTERTQDEFGLQAAVGVADGVDLRARYIRVQTKGDASTPGTGVNVFAVGPKVSLVRDRLALYVPVGFATGGDIDTGDTWEVHPTLLGTIPFNPQAELNGSLKWLVPFGGDDHDKLVAANVGLGLSSDLSKWAVRPEVGVLMNPGEKGKFFQFSVGVTRFFGR